MPPSLRSSAWLRPRGASLGLLYITLATLSSFISTSSAESTHPQLPASTGNQEEGDRTGNWTSLTCSDPAAENALFTGCAQRWSELDADDAWKDVIRVWTQYDKGKTTFSASVMNTLHAPNKTDCGLLAGGNCDQTLPCGYFEGTDGKGGSGPAATEIYNSFNMINELYYDLYGQFYSSAQANMFSIMSMEDTFAPVRPKPNEKWLLILRNLLDLGVTAITAAYLDGYFGGLPSLVALGDAGANTAKDIVNATLVLGTAVIPATVDGSSNKQWTPKTQATFSATMGQVVSGWATVVENQVYTLFNGSEAPVQLLGSMIANGNLIECNGSSVTDTENLLGDHIQKVFYGLSIPALWTVSGTHAFVVDSGYPCGTVNPLTQYMTEDTQEATYSCHNGSLYYLVYPDGGNPTHFTAPPGLDELVSGRWGNLTLSDLIAGSVNTYVANGNANGGAPASPQSQQTLQDLAKKDITTPGFITLPVCSPQVAWASWSKSNASAPSYPCNAL